MPEPQANDRWRVVEDAIMNILAVAGSLRAASINAAFCRAASRLAPPGLHITVYDALGSLPAFNTDLESDPPHSVTLFREAVGATDGLIIASPEYAHGVSGVLKNALDWLVSYEGFVAVPVAVINTSPRAHHAYDSLLEVLKTMSATLVPQASISVPLLGACTTEAQMVSTPEIARQIRGALVALDTFLRSGDQPGPSFPVESP
jgi:chromate reductase, NAD(P)H dehydrogenase (quinone)